jgi:hypothetical protein
MSQVTETHVISACRLLFGAELNLSRDFLFYLQPSGAKTAYRRCAKETHPDLFSNADPSVYETQTARFQDVTGAYQLIRDFLNQRDRGLWKPAPAAPPWRAPERRPPPTAPAGNDLPWRTLEFGLFLHYRGIIPYRTLIAALVWQRSQRPVIGEIARRWGWLNEAGTRAILSHRGPYGRFGERAIRLGLLSPFQVQTLLRYQRNLQKRLGEYFIEQGLLSATDVNQLVQEMLAHNAQVQSGRRYQHGGYAAG